MIILGIETATDMVGCAIGGHEGILASAHCGRGRRHAENLAPQIAFVCDQARVSLREVSVVAVDRGPGLYTGLRVGLATGRAIAQSLRVPMIAVSSLDLLAFAVRTSPRLVAAVVDARRSEVFWALYRRVPGGVQRLTEPQVGSPEDLAAELASTSDDVLAVGDGALRYAEVLTDAGSVEIGDRGLAHPSATSLVQLAHARALREDWVQPWEVTPLYLRRPDAEINWETRPGA